MRKLMCAVALAFTFGAPMAAAEEIAAPVMDAQQRAERAVERMIFDSGLIVATIAEVEPYMNPAVREAGLPTMTQELEPDRAEAARAYMATFDQRFGDALSRARPGMITRIADGFQAVLTPAELAHLEQFVLGEQTGPAFMRLMRQWVERGGGDQAFDVSGFTRDELIAIANFMAGPGGVILDGESGHLDRLIGAELQTFVPAFEREFFGGLCAAAGQECPSWVNEAR